jgi:hypothetical protein
MTEIKPNIVDGEPICTPECSEINCLSRGDDDVDDGVIWTCIPGLRQQRDDALLDVATLRDLFAQQNAILKQIYEILLNAYVK